MPHQCDKAPHSLNEDATCLLSWNRRRRHRRLIEYRSPRIATKVLKWGTLAPAHKVDRVTSVHTSGPILSTVCPVTILQLQIKITSLFPCIYKLLHPILFRWWFSRNLRNVWNMFGKQNFGPKKEHTKSLKKIVRCNAKLLTLFHEIISERISHFNHDNGSDGTDFVHSKALLPTFQFFLLIPSDIEVQHNEKWWAEASNKLRYNLTTHEKQWNWWRLDSEYFAIVNRHNMNGYQTFGVTSAILQKKEMKKT